MNIAANIKSMLADTENGTISSKRVITMLCTVLMAVGFVANMFFGYQVDENIFNSIMYVVIAGVGVTGVEKFAGAMKK